MIGYATLGTSDLTRAAFDDAIAGELGVGQVMETARFIACGRPGIGLTVPENGQPATLGNGVMVALEAGDAAQVDRLHALALRLGAADEGAPGPRGAFYAACFRDPDDNELNAFVISDV